MEQIKKLTVKTLKVESKGMRKGKIVDTVLLYIIIGDEPNQVIINCGEESHKNVSKLIDDEKPFKA